MCLCARGAPLTYAAQSTRTLGQHPRCCLAPNVFCQLPTCAMTCALILASGLQALSHSDGGGPLLVLMRSPVGPCCCFVAFCPLAVPGLSRAAMILMATGGTALFHHMWYVVLVHCLATLGTRFGHRRYVFGHCWSGVCPPVVQCFAIAGTRFGHSRCMRWPLLVHFLATLGTLFAR